MADADSDAALGLVMGLVASPGAATDLAERLLADLTARLQQVLPGARWIVRLVSDRLVEPPADLSQLVGAARRRLLADGWHVAVCLTDLPLQTARRPVVAHASATHGVAVLSLPALGPMAVGRRTAEGVVRLVTSLVAGSADVRDDDDAGAHRQAARTRRGVQQLSRLGEPDEHGVRLVAGVVTGNLRLLLGMIRTNRPWRVALRLSRVLVAAVAAGIFAVVTSGIWRLSGALGPLRLGLVALAAVVAVVSTIVVGADLWERVPAGSSGRDQVVLFNVVTVATVVLGVMALYLALLVVTLLAVLLLVPGALLADVLAHPVDAIDEVQLAWLVTSIATVGGALGAGLESDEAVREAAYGYVPDAELSRVEGRG
jgi:hypothetical protein